MIGIQQPLKGLYVSLPIGRGDACVLLLLLLLHEKWTGGGTGRRGLPGRAEAR
jgi:hypothetical protein